MAGIGLVVTLSVDMTRVPKFRVPLQPPLAPPGTPKRKEAVQERGSTPKLQRGLQTVAQECLPNLCAFMNRALLPLRELARDVKFLSNI